MSKPITGTQVKALFKKWNVPASYLQGFENRGRPASTAGGPFVDVKGIIIHHTASENQSAAYVDWLFRVGRYKLPPPLCQFATNKQGLTYVGALGKANHAGAGSPGVLSLVKSEKYDGYKEELKGGNSLNGNPFFYGNEVMYGGVNGEDMTDAQYKAVVRFCAALCDFHGWTAKSVIGHREWASTKIDPSYVKMYRLRSDVAALLKAGPVGSKSEVIPVPPKPVIVQPIKPKAINKLDPKSYPPNGLNVGPHISWLGQRLVVHGFKGYIEGPGPEWGPKDKEGVKWFQEKQGWRGTDADGYPGKETLARLAKAPIAMIVEPTAARETWFKLMSWNISNSNSFGVKTWRTRRSSVVRAVNDFMPDVFCTQENIVTVGKYSGRAYLDGNLTGMIRVSGGDGRYIYLRDTHKRIAGGVFDLQPRYRGDDKQAAWVVAEIRGERVLVTSYHLENEGTSDSTRIAQMESSIRQARIEAKKHGVSTVNIIHAGDTNFRTTGAISTIEGHREVDLYNSAKTQVDKSYRSFNSWRPAIKGFRIDRVWGHPNLKVIRADQRRSLFAKVDHNPQLFWIGK